jgi:uncharacterized protein (DUF433 family)
VGSATTKLGEGVYTVADASRLSGIPTRRLHRWLAGYEFRDHGGNVRHSAPVFRASLRGAGSATAISFLDLLEVMFFDRFLKQGVTWDTLRRAAAEAARDFKDDHPFCVKRFRTDGRTIFAEIAKDDHDPKLLDIVRRQHVFREIVEPLLTQIDYDVSGLATAWSPMGKAVPVIVDPTRAFGQPTLRGRGVRTSVVAASVIAGNESLDAVARWYDVEVEEVEAAVDFERRLADKRLAA